MVTGVKHASRRAEQLILEEPEGHDKQNVTEIVHDAPEVIHVSLELPQAKTNEYRAEKKAEEKRLAVLRCHVKVLAGRTQHQFSQKTTLGLHPPTRPRPGLQQPPHHSNSVDRTCQASTAGGGALLWSAGACSCAGQTW